MNGYERRTLQKKDLILKTAKELFFTVGITNTSMVDIAKKAGVSKVTIFNYFESKENLVYTVINEYLNNYVENAEKIFQTDMPFERKMESIFSISKIQYGLLGTDIFNSEIWKDPYMQRFYNEIAKKSMPLIERFFQQGKDEGIIDPTIPNESILAFVSAMVPLNNPAKHNISKEYILGINKLFYYGLFGDKSGFEEKIKSQED